MAKRYIFRQFLIALSFLVALPFCHAFCHAQKIESYDSLKIGSRTDFIENKGQWPKQVNYKVRLKDASIFFEKNCFTIVVNKPEPPNENDPRMMELAKSEHTHHFQRHNYHAYRMRFVGSNEDAQIVGRNQNAGYENYYLSNNPQEWASKCNLYATLEYQELYEGINMRVLGAQNGMKYEFVVDAGVSPNQILMKYDSVDAVIVRDGKLVVKTSVGELIEMQPYVYQSTENGNVEIQSNYIVKDKQVSFAIGAYDENLPLVIDPFLYFSTYTGSTADNWGTTAAYDSYKNTYTSGIVFDVGYPTSLGAYDSTFNGNADVGIFKFDTTGSQRLYATYLGGSNADMPHSMYVNEFDELVIFGTTGSADFPTTPTAYCRRFKGGPEIAYLCFFNEPYYRNIYYPNGSDIFISRLSSDGTQLQASTFVGGSRNDGLNYRSSYNESVQMVMQGNDSLYYNYGDGARGEIITDDQNNVYIGTTTMSIDVFEVAGSIQRLSAGRQEGLAIKMDYNLSNMIWGTYLGGNMDDAIYSIDVDNEYNLLVCGGTNSSNFPTTQGAYKTVYGGGSADGFVAKISTDGDELITSTYFGSDAYDQAYFVRSGRHDEVYIFGQTKAQGGTLIQNAFYNTPNSGQFITRLTPTLDNVVWSTVFGTGNGKPNISPTAFVADICNRVYAVGWGRDFVGFNRVQWNTAGTTGMETTTDAYQDSTDGQDFYIMSLSADAGQLDYATFFGELHQNDNDGGTDHVDGGTSRFDRLGTLYQSICASCGGYDDFPITSGVWSETNESNNCNNAIFRFNVHNNFAVAEFLQPSAGCAPYTINFQNTGRGTSFLWDFGDGTTSTDKNPTHQYTQGGLYNVRLIASQPDGCYVSDTIIRKVLVLDNSTSTTQTTLSCNGDPKQIGLPPMAGCTYEWIAGNVSDSTIANPWVYEDGDYVLKTSIAAGCTQIDTFKVSFINLIDSLIVKNPTCPGMCNGEVIAITNLEDASGSISYNWNGMISPDSILTNQCKSDSIMTLTVSDRRCEASVTYQITDPDSMIIHKDVNDILCTDTCDGWIHIWTSHEIDTLIENLCAGEYITALTDSMGCPYSDTTQIIKSSALEDFKAWADDTLIFLTESTNLHATNIPGVIYEWGPVGTLNVHTQANVIATPTDSITTYYVTATDEWGCSKTDSVTIHATEIVCGEENLYIPNAFSPNGDGINDVLSVKGEYIVEYHMMIFTRWGELIYESSDINEAWDGRYKDNWCMPGVYTYACEITCEADMKALLKGNITLIR